MNVIWRVSKYLFRYPWLFAATQGFAVLMTLTAIAIPKIIEQILEGISAGQTIQALAQGTLVIALLYLGTEVFNGMRIVVNNILEQQVLLDMRRDIHDKLLRLPVSFYDQRKSGEISSRVIEDVMEVERALLDGTEIGSRAVVMILGVTVMLFRTDPLLAWLVFLPVPILMIVAFFYARGSRKVWKHVRESAGDLNSLLVEDIQGNRLIQSFGLQPRERRRFTEQANLLRQRTLQAMFRWAIYSPGTTYMTQLGTVAVIGVGGYLMLSSPESFGYPQLVLFLIYVNMLYVPIGQLHGINHLLAAGKASGDRVFEILDADEEITESQDPQPFPSGPVEVQFHNVSFAYPERPNVLDQLELTIPAGQVTALVGHTGAGKSTIANLAMRAYDVTEGNVRINGTDIRQIQLAALHGQIGHVAQSPFLFEGTVRENLVLAKEDATEAEIVDALQGACAWEFVQKLPQGLETNIGEKGIRLSQGEKQRLTIARVLLKNPPFVILDEATASVDTVTERQIQSALDTLMQERTVLVIAHRLSTVRKAHKIVVLEHGRIIEEGSHEALLAVEGAYAHYWNVQHDFLPEIGDLPEPVSPARS